MIYRIEIEIGYRSVVLDFNTAENAGKFADEFLTHVNQKAGEKLVKIGFEILDPNLCGDEDDEDEDDE